MTAPERSGSVRRLIGTAVALALVVAVVAVAGPGEVWALIRGSHPAGIFPCQFSGRGSLPGFFSPQYHIRQTPSSQRTDGPMTWASSNAPGGPGSRTGLPLLARCQ